MHPHANHTLRFCLICHPLALLSLALGPDAPLERTQPSQRSFYPKFQLYSKRRFNLAAIRRILASLCAASSISCCEGSCQPVLVLFGKPCPLQLPLECQPQKLSPRPLDILSLSLSLSTALITLSSSASRR